jgi:hypothetical protein
MTPYAVFQAFKFMTTDPGPWLHSLRWQTNDVRDFLCSLDPTDYPPSIPFPLLSRSILLLPSQLLSSCQQGPICHPWCPALPRSAPFCPLLAARLVWACSYLFHHLLVILGKVISQSWQHRPGLGHVIGLIR